MRMGDAKDVTKLVKTTIRLMISKIGAKRALVIVGSGELGDEPEPAAAYGFAGKSVWHDPTVAVEALTHSLKNKRIVYTLDARKNEKFTTQGCHRSVTSVPLDNGVLYCDHPEPNAFRGTKAHMESLAKEFDLCYDLLGAEDGPIDYPHDDDDDPAPRNKTLLVLISVLLAAGLAGAVAYYSGWLPI